MDKEQQIRLVSAARGGDKAAMNTLLNQSYNDFYYYALQVSKNSEIACDATQDAMLAVARFLPSLQDPAGYKAWTRKILYNECLRYLKKGNQTVPFAETEEGLSEMDLLEEENAEFIPGEALERSDFRQTIMGIVRDLPEEQRSAVMMYYFDELSIREIAEIQGVSEGTVKSRLNYGRKAIKAAVENYEKKNGIKLHSFAALPLLKWLFGGDQAQNPLPQQAAAEMAKAVAEETGIAVGGTTAGTVGGTAAGAAGGIAAKVIAGITAGVLLLGGGTAALLLNRKPASESNMPAAGAPTEPEEPAQPTPGSYESETLKPYGDQLSIIENFDRFLDESAQWMLTKDGRVLSTVDATKERFEGCDVQEVFVFGKSELGYRDSAGTLHFTVGSEYPASDIKGTPLYADTEMVGLTSYALFVISMDEQGNLYYSEFDDQGNQRDAHNAPLYLQNSTTEELYTRPDRIEFYGAGSAIYVEAGGQLFYSGIPSAEYNSEENYYYLPCQPISADTKLLTYHSPTFFASGLYAKAGDDRTVHCNADLTTYSATLPEGYTLSDIETILYCEVAVLKMKDGNVFIAEDMTWPNDNVFIKHEALSALCQKGADRQLFLSSFTGGYAEVLVLADDNVLYKAFF